MSALLPGRATAAALPATTSSVLAPDTALALGVGGGAIILAVVLVVITLAVRRRRDRKDV
jgi:hypothetical protein